MVGAEVSEGLLCCGWQISGLWIVPADTLSVARSRVLVLDARCAGRGLAGALLRLPSTYMHSEHSSFHNQTSHSQYPSQ